MMGVRGLLGHARVYEVLRFLHAFYWIIVEVSDALEKAEGQVASGLNLHLALASQRVKIIKDHLRLALIEAGLNPDEKDDREKLRKIAGAISLETLEKIRETLKGLTEEYRSKGSPNISRLTSRLLELADVVNIAASILKTCGDTLEKNTGKHAWRIRLILQAIVKDLEFIAQMHQQLASNPQMLESPEAPF
jgi:thioredoxin-like negative regulator of GroEL